MKVVSSRSDLAAARAGLPTDVGLVPTMGALHEGHEALLHAARSECASVLATIFVNPMQFGPTEDLARYPRPVAADLERAAAAGVDLVWHPAADVVYPAGKAKVKIDPGPLGAELEGASRPTHFAGVLTVVAKFFSIIRPDRAYFGEKDYQQLTLVRRMVTDLDLGVAVRAVPTVREPDGLARSSRNVYLSADDRKRAVVLFQALFAGRDAAAKGPDAVLAAASEVLDGAEGVAVDYLALRGADLGPVPADGPARLLVAARVGSTRLIDNVGLVL